MILLKAGNWSKPDLIYEPILYMIQFYTVFLVLLFWINFLFIFKNWTSNNQWWNSLFISLLNKKMLK